MTTDFRSFRAWRYNPRRIELGRAIAPPYDVISPAEREELYAKSSYNVVRLILGKETDFYEKAAEWWREWTRDGILIQEERPALYLYEQTFKHPWDSRPMRRLAILGILKLDESDLVLRHEATFEGPRRDRLLLLEKTRTNLSPIFGLYQDANKRLARLFSSSQKNPPLFQTPDDEGTLHRGWMIQEKKDQDAIREVIQGSKIFIADGHHRFETAVEYRRKMREKSPGAPPDAPYDFVMMALVESGDEGLLVLPTHRIIRSFVHSSLEEFLSRLHAHFDFLPHSEAEIFSELSRRPSQEKVFGLLLGKNGSFLLRLKDPSAAQKLMPAGKPPIWYEVEANLLTHLVFEVLWKLPEDERRNVVEYTRSWEEAARRIREGKAEAAFLMRTPDIDTIRKLADTGERMPQKTTYFYPKLASGLFFYHHD